MLVLLDWAGTNISIFFEMRVWGFAPLCWLFLHTVFDFIYFWIFGVFVPKGQMGFNFNFFPKFGIFTSFCVLPYFLEFSWHNVVCGPWWSVWIIVRPILHLLLHWDACCIRPLDSVFGWGTCCFVFSSSPLSWSSWWWCATHEYVRVHCQMTWESRSSVVLPGVMIIGVGLGICMPTGTHHWMSMGRVG